MLHRAGEPELLSTSKYVDGKSFHVPDISPSAVPLGDLKSTVRIGGGAMASEQLSNHVSEKASSQVMCRRGRSRLETGERRSRTGYERTILTRKASSDVTTVSYPSHSRSVILAPHALRPVEFQVRRFLAPLCCYAENGSCDVLPPRFGTDYIVSRLHSYGLQVQHITFFHTSEDGKKSPSLLILTSLPST